MAAIKHARTIALQATSPRIVAVPLPTNITADWTTNVTGTGKPANDATQNRIQTGASFSGTPVNGDIWIDTSVTPNIVRTRIGGAWVASANNITNTNQMTDGAGLGTTADWGSVYGTGKPADDATKNRIQTGTSFSGTPVNGDIWIDTNTSPAIVKTRVSGAWVSSANYTTNTTQLTDGAGLGTTATWAGVTGTGKPSSYADVTTTIMGNSGTSILMTASNLFKSASGLGGVFIGSGGLFGKNTSGVTTFSIDGATGAAVFAGSLSAATGTFAGSLSAATGSFAGSLSAATGSFGAVTAGGAVTVNTSGSISSGISYGGTGIFLGYSGSAYKFSVGDATKYLRWDGSTLTFTGALSAATGTFNGTLSASSITSGTLTSASVVIPSSAGGNLIDIGYNSTVISYRELAGYNINAGNLSSPGASAITGTSGTAAAGVYGKCTASGGHGVRGEAGTALGFVGYSYGTYDFYAAGLGTYGPFTGSHDALVPKGTALEVGDIVCDLDVAVRKGVSDTICVVARSTAPGQGAAVGVVCALARDLEMVHELPAAMMERFWSHPPEAEPIESVNPVPEWYALRLTHDAITINALGEGMVNVCGQGGNLQPGDLITTSSTPGKGMKQADDVVRASSVAKCREAVIFDSPGQVRMVACIYLCG